MKNIILIMGLMLASHTMAQEPGIRMNFSPESDKFVDSTKQYQEIWKAEGSKMIAAMEAVSGMTFVDTEVSVIIFEGASNSGFKDKPMKLRASYPEEVKKATLIHELGHRLNVQLQKRPDNIDEHRILFLYLYEVWTKLYGQDFADRMVAVEKKRKGLYDYESAWNWALALTKDERAAKLKEIVKTNA